MPWGQGGGDLAFVLEFKPKVVSQPRVKNGYIYIYIYTFISYIYILANPSSPGPFCTIHIYHCAHAFFHFFIPKAENNRQLHTFDPALLGPSHFSFYLHRFWTIFFFLADSHTDWATFALLASSGAPGARLDDSS